MKLSSRIISVIIALLMLISTFPMTVFAAPAESLGETSEPVNTETSVNETESVTPSENTGETQGVTETTVETSTQEPVETSASNECSITKSIINGYSYKTNGKSYYYSIDSIQFEISNSTKKYELQDISFGVGEYMTTLDDISDYVYYNDAGTKLTVYFYHNSSTFITLSSGWYKYYLEINDSENNYPKIEGEFDYYVDAPSIRTNGSGTPNNKPGGYYKSFLLQASAIDNTVGIKSFYVNDELYDGEPFLTENGVTYTFSATNNIGKTATYIFDPNSGDFTYKIDSTDPEVNLGDVKDLSKGTWFGDNYKFYIQIINSKEELPTSTDSNTIVIIDYDSKVNPGSIKVSTGNIDASITKDSESDNRYIVTISKSGKYYLSVCDYVGNGYGSKADNDPLEIGEFKINQNNTQADDIHVIFEIEEGSPLLNFLTFGIYRNTKLKATVKVKSPDGAPINSIKMGDIKPKNDISKQTENNEVYYSGVFEYDVTENKTTVFDTHITIEEAGFNDSVTFDLSDVKVSFADEDKDEFEENLKILLSDAVPYVPSGGVTIAGESVTVKNSEGDYTCYGKITKINVLIFDGIFEDKDSNIQNMASLENAKITLQYNDEVIATNKWSFIDENTGKYSKTGQTNVCIIDTDVLNNLKNGTYDIYVSAKNSFGNEFEEKVSSFNYDTGSIIIDSISYESDCDSEWTNSSKKITFKVSNQFNEFNMIDTENVTVLGQRKTSNGKIISDSITAEYNEEKNEFSFIASHYGYYCITAKDLLYSKCKGDHVNYEFTKCILFDNIAPTITDIEFDKNNINYLPFGIYSQEDLKITFNVTDYTNYEECNESSSGFYSAGKVVIDNKSIDTSILNASPEEPGELDEDTKNDLKDKLKKGEEISFGPEVKSTKCSSSFTIKTNDETVYKSSDISITIEDEANNTTTVYLNKYAEAEKNNLHKFSDDYEIALSKSKAEIGTEKWDDPSGSIYYKGDEKLVYIKDGTNSKFSVSYSDTITKLNKVVVTLNGADITDDCKYFIYPGTDKEEKCTESFFTDLNNHTGNKIDHAGLSFNILDSENIKKHLIKASSNKTGKNTIHIEVTSNNGALSSKDFYFYIDDVAPDISNFTFINAENTSDSNTSIDKKDLNYFIKEGTVLSSDRYGYFFKNSMNVTIEADDIEGVGIKQIYLVLKDYTSDPKTITAEDTIYSSDDVGLQILPDNKAKCTFTIQKNFKGYIYAYAYDHMSNQGDNYSPNDVIVEDEDKFDESTSISVTPENVSGYDNNKHPLYSGDVSLKIDANASYSGIHKIEFTISSGADADLGRVFTSITSQTYYLKVDNEGTIVENTYPHSSNFKVTENDKNLATRITGSIIVPSSEYNVNNIKVTATLTDRSNVKTKSADTIFSIDIDPPVISIERIPEKSTNDYNGTEYFNEARTIIVTVTERNFDVNKFDWEKAINTDGPNPSYSGKINWNTLEYTDYTDKSTHVAELYCNTDGDYEIDFDCIDEAGNKATKDNWLPFKFTVDLIKPVISISLYKNDSINTIKRPGTNYYSAKMQAKIEINEHNFTADSGYVTYTPTATGPDNSTPKTAPSIGNWTSSGDIHTAYIDFNSDGKYSYTIGFKDLALNAANNESQPTFYVDTTAPELEIINIENEKAYDGTVEPGITYMDYNYSNAAGYKLDPVLSIISYDFDDQSQTGEKITDYSKNEDKTGISGSVIWDNFAGVPEYDGVYHLYATICDLAGNQSEKECTFSVNRFGSTFLAGDSSTNNLRSGSNYLSAGKDVIVKEINVNKVSDQNVSLSYNSNTNDLVEGTDYKITHNGDGVHSWFESVYTVNKNNFQNEGKYILTLSSKDPWSETVSNRTAYKSEDGKINKTFPIEFTIDKTAPDVYITGVKDGEWSGEAEVPIEVSCEDVNIDPDTLMITVDDNVLAPDVDYEVENSGGILTAKFTMNANGNSQAHIIDVKVKDLASTEGSGKVQDFHLAANIFERFIHNTTALIIAGAALLGIAGLIVFLSLRKKKAAK